MIALMYHDIVPTGHDDESGFPGRDAARYKISPDLFDAHLAALPGSHPAYPAHPAHPAHPALSLTFDDGGSSGLRVADALERRGLRGSFFVTANYIGTPGFLDMRSIRELVERGHVVGSHSCSHPLRMGHCSWPQLVNEWTRSRTMLEDIIGGDVREASVPGGDFAPQVAEAAARAGFRRLFTSEPTRGERQAFGLTLVGRYTMLRSTTPEEVAGLVSGAWLPCARQMVTWNAKKMSKRLGGEQYLKIRKLLLRHGDEVRWGDKSA